MKLFTKLKTAVAEIASLEKWEELKSDPGAVPLWLEEHAPKLAQKTMGYASIALNPYFVGRGLFLSSWSDDHAEAILPYRRSNRSPRGEIYLSALTGAAEFVTWSLLERHLDPVQYKAVIVKASIQLTEPVLEEVALRVAWLGADRDRLFFALQTEGRASMEMVVSILSGKSLKVGQVQLELQCDGQTALPGKKP